AIYSDMARHYELAVLPARIRRPQDKSLVEGMVKMEVPRLKGLAAAEHLLSLQETLRKCAKKPYTDAGASPGPSP
ncbi:MAG: hypothetical protein OXU68_12400, partial [Bacteroidota bacterium]|nr:hypothetical protein [Bacteroidota bacterium]